MTQHVFPVPAALKSTAHVDAQAYQDLYRRSLDDPEGFWREQARILDWVKPFTRVKNTHYAPDDVTIEWFADGTLNASFNCLDRHARERATMPRSCGRATLLATRGESPGRTCSSRSPAWPMP